MSGGGGSQQSTTYTSNLPAYAEPYVTDVMGRAQEASMLPYTPYGGERTAGFSPEQTQAQGMIGGMAEMGDPLGVRYGQQIGVDTANTLRGYQYNPMGFSTGPGVTAGQVGDLASSADSDLVNRYMNPFTELVVDREKAGAARDYGIAQQTRNAKAAQAGAFGGSRQAVMEAEAERGLLSNMNNIEAKGLRDAYDRAQQYISGDRSAYLQGAGLDINSKLQADLANQNSFMDAQRNTEASRQFGAQSGLQAMQQLGSLGDSMANQGATAQKLAMDRINALNATGAQRQAIEQAKLDQSYQQFATARDYEQNMINWYNSVLRGTPIGVDQTVYNTPSQPSFASQLIGIGTGIAGLGMYK